MRVVEQMLEAMDNENNVRAMSITCSIDQITLGFYWPTSYNIKAQDFAYKSTVNPVASITIAAIGKGYVQEVLSLNPNTPPARSHHYQQFHACK
jgi:hypothetical protein